MKVASLKDIKEELKSMTRQEIMDICVTLAKSRKENKELITYLLYEQQDEDGFISGVKKIIVDGFKEINRNNLYLAKKTIRKTLRDTQKHIRFSGKKETEVALLIFFCKQFKDSGIRYKTSPALTNIFDRQVLKIGKIISQLDEDLQYDFSRELEPILK